VSLTTGRGPLSGNPAGRFNVPVPDHVVYVEPFPRRVRGVVAGRTVVDSDRVLLVHRPGEPPRCAFPATDVTGVTGVAEGTGAAGVEGIVAEPVPEAPGHVHVPWRSVEAWYEEDERMLGHPRNPYHRVDCVRTSRRLHVEVAGVALVDTRETLGVYETALEPRLYVARDHVRMDLLVASPTTSYCPYKGTASYWSALVGGAIVEDVAWCYEDPLPESLPLGGLLSFDGTRATVTHDLPPVVAPRVAPPRPKR
jgi:uncharacterized protein (DUF427 family)